MAQWLLSQGFTEVAVLSGGLEAWRRRGYPVVRIPSSTEPPAVHTAPATAAPLSAETAPLTTFLPHLAESGLLQPQRLPARRELAVLFVDMANSTALLYHHTVEEAFALIQAFMEEVTETAVAYCGDVKDFEGDGALLYFESVKEAVPAAFALRRALLAKRRRYPALPLPRLSLNAGPLLIGVIGSRFRQSIAMVGPALPIAARLLKHAPPGGIIATDALVAAARAVHPDLAARFRPQATPLQLDGIEEGPVRVYLVPPEAA
ncbi:MAG: hypothetical protein KatS3mg131_3627 [Candidatus Tectimicrobiota bacterium]|nr:MAG: hypothetical protein KatS3mg131_3627 [Candidatus Tectomicrobia bacterium]